MKAYPNDDIAAGNRGSDYVQACMGAAGYEIIVSEPSCPAPSRERFLAEACYAPMARSARWAHDIEMWFRGLPH